MCKAAAILGALVLWTGAAMADDALGDPTLPTPMFQSAAPRAVAHEGPRWRLQSTLVAQGRRRAVINGRSVAPGERIDGATVVSIDRDVVTLDSAGERVSLRVLPGTVSVRQKQGG